MKYNSVFEIQGQEISLNSPTYFIADVASNHDGDLERAKQLIWLAKEAGADAVKFQHFKAEKIVSDYGFKNLGSQQSHQASWKKSVFEIYRDYECNRAWTETLVETAKQANIHFFTTPYDEEALELMNSVVPAYKIGSGDITWTDFIEKVSKKGKPVILATGASTIDDVDRAVRAVLKHNPNFGLMQCNTNYTGNLENFKYIHLNVLRTFSILYPNMVLGLSDHTPGHATVLGAVTLGARLIEKHFTDNNDRNGPDHPFSMNPSSWREMVERTRELELALGGPVKRIEPNEEQTVVLQQRCLRLVSNMSAGDTLQEHDLEALRPAPTGSVPPFRLADVVGKKLIKEKVAGDALYFEDFEPVCLVENGSAYVP